MKLQTSARSGNCWRKVSDTGNGAAAVPVAVAWAGTGSAAGVGAGTRSGAVVGDWGTALVERAERSCKYKVSGREANTHTQKHTNTSHTHTLTVQKRVYYNSI